MRNFVVLGTEGHKLRPVCYAKSMTVDNSVPTGIEARGQPRSSMFLAAVLRAGAEQAAVKVRNMSPKGAMVESPLRPPPGTEVHLIRGVLLAKATIIWSSNNRCGLRFSSEVSVKEWLAAPTKAEQQRVDEIVALVKAGAIHPAVADSCDIGASTESRSEEQLVGDLGIVISLIQDLEEDLSSSTETLARHGLKLQNLDIAMQMIQAIAQELTSDHRDQAISLAKLEDLRIASAQALPTRQHERLLPTNSSPERDKP